MRSVKELTTQVFLHEFPEFDAATNLKPLFWKLVIWLISVRKRFQATITSRHKDTVYLYNVLLILFLQPVNRTSNISYIIRSNLHVSLTASSDSLSKMHLMAKAKILTV